MNQLARSLLKASSSGSVLSNRLSSSFKFNDMQYEIKKNKPDLPDDPAKLTFGHKFSDHMLSIEWSAGGGWKKPVIHPMRNLSLHPAAKVLHYSIELFEGMKAYKGVDGKIRMFRPELNMTRMLKSSIRSTLPEFDRDELLKSIKKLISIDSDWIPNSTAASMYVRPTFIGTEPTLGVSSSNTALLYVIMSPIGPYFPTGFKPISLLADTKYVRAFKGGVGNFKVGSNYGPTIYVGIQAQKEKCQQVLWLLGKEEYITEAGTMNIFIVTKNKKGEYEMMTPPLDGTILEGVTRQSVLDLGRKWNDFKVTERQITMKELLEFQDRNELVEMFGAGTACVVCPIDGVLYNGKRHEIKTMTSGGAIMNRISKTINDIQYGKIQSDWGSLVE